MIRIFEVSDGHMLNKYSIANEEITILDLSRDDDYIAINHNYNISIMNLSSGLIKDITRGVNAKFFTDSSKLVVAYGTANGAGLWDLNQRKEILLITDTNTRKVSIDISSDDNKVVFGYGGGNQVDKRFGHSIMFDLHTGEQLCVFEEDPTYAVDSVDFFSSGHFILTAHGPSIANAEINLWEVDTGKRLKRIFLDQHAMSTIQALVFSDNEKFVVVRAWLSPIWFFDIQTSEIIAKYDIGNGFEDFTLSPQGNFFAVWNDGEIQIYNINFKSGISNWKKK